MYLWMQCLCVMLKAVPIRYTYDISDDILRYAIRAHITCTI